MSHIYQLGNVSAPTSDGKTKNEQLNPIKYMLQKCIKPGQSWGHKNGKEIFIIKRNPLIFFFPSGAGE